MSPKKLDEQLQMFGARVTQYKAYGHFSSVFFILTKTVNYTSCLTRFKFLTLQMDMDYMMMATLQHNGVFPYFPHLTQWDQN